MTKTFSTAAAISLTEGTLYSDFGEFHQLAEWIMGHSIFTHEFADPALAERMKEALFAQHPELREFAKHTGETWQQALARAEERWGKKLKIAKGGEKRTEHPVDSLERLAPGKQVVVVEAKPDVRRN